MRAARPEDPAVRARFEQTLRELLDRTRDAELQSRIWDYREGLITKVELNRDETFRREMQAWYAEELDRLAERGITTDDLRAFVEARRQADTERGPETLHQRRDRLRAELEQPA